MASPNDHLFQRGGKAVGRWYLGPSYRDNGYRTILGDAGRKKVYERPDLVRDRLQGNVGRLKPISPRPPGPQIGDDAHVARYGYTYEKNWQTGKRPYRNQAHHLLPKDTFIQLFSEPQQEILKQVDYDVNNGENIMFLPEWERDRWFHHLPSHRGGHAAYSASVKEDAAELAEKLEEAMAKPCEASRAAEIVQELRQLQRNYWNQVKAAGRARVNRVRVG